MKKLLQTAFCLTAVASLGILPAAGQTTANWIGPTSGGEWNTGANWDVGYPPLDPTTNAIIPGGSTVEYDLPMVATAFGALTNNGILLINTNGFNCASIDLNTPSGGDQLYINDGAVVTVTGNLNLGTNTVGALAAGASLTVNQLNVAYGNSTKANATSYFTNNGGTIYANGTSINNNTGTSSGRLVINGGINNLGKTVIGRYHGTSVSTLGTEGLAIRGGVVTMTNLDVGNNGQGASYLTAYIADGIVTNFGSVFINNVTAGRYSRLIQTSGLFVVPDPGVINPNSTTAGSVTSVYAVLGGTNIVGGFYFGNSNTLVGATALFTNAAAMYIGSQGIASNGISISTFALNNGSTLGATADWIGMVPLTLNVGTSSIKTADLDGTIHNITLSNAVVGPGGFNLIGGGILTLDGTNTYTGGTTISNGTLVLGPSGALASSPITVGSGATFDVSQAPGFILGSGKTIAGVGTVSGAFAADGGSTISPAGIGAQGTLHFSSSLSVSNASFNMELGNDPSGVSNPNDQVAVAGDFNAAGTNTIAITPVGSLGIGTYKLITFTGNFNGGLTNLICAAGMVTNHAGEIDLVVTQVRPVENLTWKGDGSANLWDTGVSSNWFNGVGMDRFYTGDTNNFTDSTTNFVVNISGVVTPAPTAVVLVNAANDYTFQGNGDISGTTGLTKTNSGKLTILNNNDYTGVTTLGGGTLSVTNLAIGGVSSPIGAAGSAAANLVFNGGALEYLGSNVTIDRSMTLEASGGSLSITNGSTLTLSGSLTGPGILTKIGNGQLSLATSSDYSGGTTINAGTVRAAQGSGATITSLGSGTLTLNGGASSATFLFGGDGETLNNTLGIVGTNNFIANNGNDTINALTGTGTVYLNGASGNILSLHAIDMSAFGGTFSLNTLPVLRFFPSTGTSADASGATFDLGINGGIVYNRDGGTYRLGAVTGGTTSILRGSQNSGSAATTYIVGGNNQNAAYNGNITAGAGGVGAIVNIVKTGTGTWSLVGGVITNITSPDGFTYYTNVLGTNLLHYTGSTTISNGTLALVVPDALTASTTVTLASPTAILDASAMGYVSNQYDSDGVTLTNVLLFTNSIFEVISSQTFGGVGSIVASNVLLDSGSIFAPGLPQGTLAANHNVEMAGTVNMSVNAAGTPNCSAVSAASFTVDGTAVLNISNGGPEAGATFQLFNHAVSGFSAVNLPPLSGTNSWVNNLAVDGSITMLAPALSLVNTNSTNIVVNVSGNALNLSWPSDHTGWRLQVQTNTLATGLNVNSNAWFDVAGSTSTNAVSIPINTGSGSVFYRMVYP